MSFWDAIKEWASSAWRWVKNLFSWDTYGDTVKEDTNQDTWKQTLNEQIVNWTINNPTLDGASAVNISGFDEIWQYLEERNTPTVKQEPMNDVAVEDREDDNFLGKLWNWFSWTVNDIQDIANSWESWINNTINSLINSRNANAEYDNLEELYAVWYNPDNKNVYYLDLNEDRWFFDWDFWTHEWVKDRFEELLNEYITEANLPWTTQADIAQAYRNFYDEAKRLFRIRSDDYYMNWFLWKTWRRSDMYTQDELNSLETYWKTDVWRYEPTPEEFDDFVAMYLRNVQTRNDLWIQYTRADNNTEDFNLWNMQSDWMERQINLAMKDTGKYFEPLSVLDPNSSNNAQLTYRSLILPSDFGRWYAYMAPLYRAEQEILSRDSSTWSEYDKQTLEAANIARQMDEQYARNENEILRQTLLYWTNKKWKIVNTPDVFENWESLNDVQTKWLRELAWLDRTVLSEHRSALDIVEKFTNDALYNYKKDKDWPVKKAWNELEHFIAPAWGFLWEAWQATRALWMDAVWTVSMGILYDWLTKEYMDQDATVWRLLETDDSNIGRTIKKYYLDVTEYTPEVIWNLLPDLAVYAATWPGWLTTTARHIWNISRAYKATKAAEWASMLNKFKVITWLTRWGEAAKALWMSKNAYSAIINATKTAPKIKNYQTIKTAAELIDRTVTQFWLWQLMDAQWSAYDTEPYSQASFMMSAIWSWLFDIMPELARLWTWLHWWNLINGKWWDNVWSLAKYIDSSPEAAENVARMLRKWTWDLWFEDLKAFVKSYWAIEDAAKQAYKNLTPEQQAAIGKMTKDLTYSYVNQAFGSNSTIGKRVRKILQNKNTNIADAIKYLGNIPGEVSVWPFVSTIKFKNWPRANVLATWDLWEYDPILDSALNWGFATRIENWFSQADLDKLSKFDWYSDIEKNKWKWFDEITNENWTTYYLNEEWLNHFWLKAENMSLESLWISIKEAQNTREALMKIKWAKWVKISPDAIDNLADSWWYDEITLKVKEVLWC